MPDPNYTELQNAWMDFIRSVKTLMVLQMDDRPLDQFLQFRDKVLDIVQGGRFVAELQTAFGRYAPEIQDHSDALILELKSFSRAVEVGETIEKEKPEKKGWRSRWLERASTVTGSVKDFTKENSWVKGGLTLFEEACDIFK